MLFRSVGWLSIVRASALALALAAEGCSSTLAPSGNAHPPHDGSVDLSGLFSSTPCGGTVGLAGTTPAGPFHGDTVNVIASYGALTEVLVSIGDTRSGMGFQWHYAWTPPDGGAGLAMVDATLYGDLLTAGSVDSLVLGTVTITSATNPATVADAGAGGQLDATMAFSGSGVDLSGALSSPYCAVSLSRARD